MKSILNNKFVVFGVAFILGALLIWFIKPTAQPEVAEEHNHVSSNSVYTCSMHPQIRQNEPGDCPICGMDLIPIEDNNNISGIDPTAVSMSETAMQLASVSTMVVGQGASNNSIRLSGKVQEDERLVHSQTAHFGGRIEELKVNFNGEYVNKGSVVAHLYSPDLVTAQEELLETYKMKDSQPRLYNATREKLKNWKLTDKQIDRMISSGTVRERFPLVADHSGYVKNKKVSLGDYVSRGQSLFDLANLSRVWVLFDVYEQQLAAVKKGDKMKFSVSSLPGKTFTGTIDYIDPIIDPQTRVAQARIVVNNTNGELKPEMFVTGSLETSTDDNQAITIPKSAVMWTGKRSVVYVKLQTDQGVYFNMREIELGATLGTNYEVKSGLELGEEIAVNGTFSIDAAAQLAGKPSMMAPEGGAGATGHLHGDAPSGTIPSLPEQMKAVVNTSDKTYEVADAFTNQLKSVFQAYLPVKDALVDSNADKAKAASEKLALALDKVDMSILKGEAHDEWMKDLKVLRESITTMSKAKDLSGIRLMLLPLSDQLYHSLKKFEVNVDGYRQYCPMAMNNLGAFWLSDSDSIFNPYFGEQMLTCGNVDEEL